MGVSLLRTLPGSSPDSKIYPFAPPKCKEDISLNFLHYSGNWRRSMARCQGLQKFTLRRTSNWGSYSHQSSCAGIRGELRGMGRLVLDV